jgi:hypothetical protein
MLRLEPGNHRHSYGLYFCLTLVVFLNREPELLQGPRAECGMCGGQPQQAGMDRILENQPYFRLLNFCRLVSKSIFNGVVLFISFALYIKVFWIWVRIGNVDSDRH